MTWTVETLNAVVDGELRSLPSDMRARFARICELIGGQAWNASAHRMYGI